MSNSEWCSPVVLVLKKDGSIRFCIDFRYLNSVSKFDSYPMPRADELLERVGRLRFVSTLDLEGYGQEIGTRGQAADCLYNALWPVPVSSDVIWSLGGTCNIPEAHGPGPAGGPCILSCIPRQCCGLQLNLGRTSVPPATGPPLYQGCLIDDSLVSASLPGKKWSTWDTSLEMESSNHK